MAERALPDTSGVGLRLAHIAEVAAQRPPAAWFEVHPENFLANPHANELLADIAETYPISMHSVGISIGSADGIDKAHLQAVRTLVDRFNPILVSGHLAWSTHQGEYLNDLLPLPYDEETLRILALHLDEVHETLDRPYLVENPASYLGFATSTMAEVEFLMELSRRTGCRLLCDVSNIYLSSHNMGFDAYAYLDGFAAEAIGELHLGGFTAEPDEGDERTDILIDTHAAAIAEPVWELYGYAIRRFGRKPTLIEWDNAMPPFATLLAEASRADRVAADALVTEIRRAITG